MYLGSEYMDIARVEGGMYALRYLSASIEYFIASIEVTTWKEGEDKVNNFANIIFAVLNIVYGILKNSDGLKSIGGSSRMFCFIKIFELRVRRTITYVRTCNRTR